MIKTHRNRNWNVDRRLRIISGKPELRPAHKSYAGIRHSFLKIIHGEKTPKNARLLEAHLHNYIIQWRSSVKRTESFLKLAHRKILFVHFFCCRVAEVSNKYILDYFMKEALLSYIMLELNVLREPDYRQNKVYKSALKARLMRLLWTIYSKYHLYLTGRSDPVAVWEIISRFLEHELPSNVPDFFNQILEDIRKNLPPVPKHPMLPYYTKRFKKHEPIQLFEEAVDTLYNPRKSSSIQIDLNTEGSARIKNGNRSTKELDELEVEFGRELTNRLKAVQNRKPPGFVQTSTDVRHTNIITRTNLKANSTICLSDDSEDEYDPKRHSSRLQIYRPPNDVIDLTKDDDDEECEEKTAVSQQPMVNDELRQCLLNQAKSLMSNFQILAGAKEVTLRLKDGQFELDAGNQRFTDKTTSSFRELDASVKKIYEIAFGGCQDALNHDYLRLFQSVGHPLTRDVPLITSVRSGSQSSLKHAPLLHPGLNLCIADENGSEILRQSQLRMENFPEATPLEKQNSLPQSTIKDDRIVPTYFRSPLQEPDIGKSRDLLKMLPVDFSVQTLGIPQNMPSTSPSVEHVDSTVLAGDNSCNKNAGIISPTKHDRADNNEEICKDNNSHGQSHITENQCLSSEHNSPIKIDNSSAGIIEQKETELRKENLTHSVQQWVSSLQHISSTNSVYEDNTKTIKVNIGPAATKSLNNQDLSALPKCLEESNSAILSGSANAVKETSKLFENVASAMIENEEASAKTDLETESGVSSNHGRQIDEELLLAGSEYHGPYKEVDEDVLLREENENCHHSLSNISDSKANSAVQAVSANESKNFKSSQTSNDNSAAITILSNVLISSNPWKVEGLPAQTKNVDSKLENAEFEWCPVEKYSDEANRSSEDIQSFEDPLSVSTNMLSEPLCAKQDKSERPVPDFQPNVIPVENNDFRNLGDDQIIAYVPGRDLYTRKQLIILKEEGARERDDPRKDIEAAQNSSEIAEESVLNLSSHLTGPTSEAQKIRTVNELFDGSNVGSMKILNETTTALLDSTICPLHITSESIASIQEPIRSFSQKNIETIDHSTVEPTKVPNSYLQGSQSCPDNKLMELAGIALQYENRDSGDGALQREASENIDSSDSESKLKIDERCSSPETVDTWNKVAVTKSPAKKRKPRSRSGSTRYRTKAELKCMLALEQSNNSFSEDDMPLADRLEKGFQVYPLLNEGVLRSNKTTSSFKPTQRGRPRLGKRGRPLGRKTHPSSKSPTGSTYTAKLRSQSTSEKEKEETNITAINGKLGNVSSNNNKSPRNVDKIKRKSTKLPRETSEELVNSSPLFTSPNVSEMASKDPLAALPSKKRYLLLEKKQPFLEETTKRLEERQKGGSSACTYEMISCNSAGYGFDSKFFSRNDETLAGGKQITQSGNENKEKSINERKQSTCMAEEELSLDDLPLSQLKPDKVPIVPEILAVSNLQTEKLVKAKTDESHGDDKEITVISAEDEKVNLISELSENTNNAIKAQEALVSESILSQTTDQNKNIQQSASDLGKLDKVCEELTSVPHIGTKDISNEIPHQPVTHSGDVSFELSVQKVDQPLFIENSKTDSNNLDEKNSCQLAEEAPDLVSVIETNFVAEQTFETIKSEDKSMNLLQHSVLPNDTLLDKKLIIEPEKISKDTENSSTLKEIAYVPVGSNDSNSDFTKEANDDSKSFDISSTNAMNKESDKFDVKSEEAEVLKSGNQSSIGETNKNDNDIITIDEEKQTFKAFKIDQSKVSEESDHMNINSEVEAKGGVPIEPDDVHVTKEESESANPDVSNCPTEVSKQEVPELITEIDESCVEIPQNKDAYDLTTEIEGEEYKNNSYREDSRENTTEIATFSRKEVDELTTESTKLTDEIFENNSSTEQASKENAPEIITETEKPCSDISETSVTDLSEDVIVEIAKPYYGENNCFSDVQKNALELMTETANSTISQSEELTVENTKPDDDSNKASSDLQASEQNAPEIVAETEKTDSDISRISVTPQIEDVHELIIDCSENNCSSEVSNDIQELITETAKSASENSQIFTIIQSEEVDELAIESSKPDDENNSSVEVSSDIQPTPEIVTREEQLTTESVKPDDENVCFTETSNDIQTSKENDLELLTEKSENFHNLVTETATPCGVSVENYISSETSSDIKVDANAVAQNNNTQPDGEDNGGTIGIQPSNEEALDLITETAKLCTESSQNFATAPNEILQELAIETAKLHDENFENFCKPNHGLATENVIDSKTQLNANCSAEEAVGDTTILCDYVCEVDVHSESNASEYDVVYGSLYESLKNVNTTESQLNEIKNSRSSESDILVSNLDIGASSGETIASQVGSSLQESILDNQHPMLCDYVREVDVHSENHFQDCEDAYKSIYESLKDTNIENSNAKDVLITQSVVSIQKGNENEEQHTNQDDSLFRSNSESEGDSEIIMDPKYFKKQKGKYCSKKQSSEDVGKSKVSSKNLGKTSKKASSTEKKNEQVEVHRKTRSKNQASETKEIDDSEVKKYEQQSNKSRGRRQSSSKKEEFDKSIAKENRSATITSSKKSKKSASKVILHENDIFAEFSKKERSSSSKPIETTKREKQETGSLIEPQRKNKYKKSDDGYRQEDEKLEQRVIKSSKKSSTKYSRSEKNDKRASKTKHTNDSTENCSLLEPKLNFNRPEKEPDSIIEQKRTKPKVYYKENKLLLASSNDGQKSELKSKIKDHNVKLKKNDVPESESKKSSLHEDKSSVSKETELVAGILNSKMKEQKDENAKEQESRDNNKLTSSVDDKKTKTDFETFKPRNVPKIKDHNLKAKPDDISQPYFNKNDKSPSLRDEKKSLSTLSKPEIELKPSKPKDVSKSKDHNLKAKLEDISVPYSKKNDKLTSLRDEKKSLPILSKTEVELKPSRLKDVSKIKVKPDNTSELYSKKNDKLSSLRDEKKSLLFLSQNDMSKEIEPEHMKVKNVPKVKAKADDIAALDSKKEDKIPTLKEEKKSLPILSPTDITTEIELEPSKVKNAPKVKAKTDDITTLDTKKLKVPFLRDEKKSLPILSQTAITTEIELEPSKVKNASKAKGKTDDLDTKKLNNVLSLRDEKKSLPILSQSDRTTEIELEPAKVKEVPKIKANTDDITTLDSKKSDKVSSLTDDKKSLPFLSQSGITTEIELEPSKVKDVSKIKANTDDITTLDPKEHDKVPSLTDDKKSFSILNKSDIVTKEFNPEPSKIKDHNRKDDNNQTPNLTITKEEETKTNCELKISKNLTKSTNIENPSTSASTEFESATNFEEAKPVSKNVEQKMLSVVLIDLNKPTDRKRKSFKHEEYSTKDIIESVSVPRKKSKTEITDDDTQTYLESDSLPGKRKGVDSGEDAQNSKRICIDPVAFPSEEPLLNFVREFENEKNDQYTSPTIEVTPMAEIGASQIDLGHAVATIPENNLLTNPDYEEAPIMFTNNGAAPMQSVPESQPYEIEFPDFFGITETVVETTSQQMFDFAFDSVVTTNSSPFSNSEVQLEAFQTQFNSIYQDNPNSCINVSSVSSSLSQTSPYQAISVNEGDFTQFCAMKTTNEDNQNDHSYADGVETVKNFQNNLQRSPAMAQQPKEPDHNPCMSSIMMQTNTLQYSNNNTVQSDFTPLTVSQNPEFHEMYQGNSGDCIAVTTVPQTVPYQTISVSSSQNLQQNSNTLPQSTENVVSDLGCTMDSMISGTMESENVLVETTLGIGGIDNISGSLESDVLDETNWQQSLELLCLQTNNSKHKAVIADIKSLDIIDDGTTGDFESDLSGTSSINPMVSELLEKKAKPSEAKKPEKIAPVLDISRRNPQREKLRPPPRRKDFQPIISGDQSVRVKPMHELLTISQTVEKSPKNNDKGKSPRLFLQGNPEDNDNLTKTTRLQTGRSTVNVKGSKSVDSVQFSNSSNTPSPQNRCPESPIRLETRRATREYQQALIREQQEAKVEQALDPFDQIKNVPTNPLFEKRQKGVKKTKEPRNLKKGKPVKPTEYATYLSHHNSDFDDNHDDIRWPPEGNSPKHRNTVRSNSESASYQSRSLLHEPHRASDPHVPAATKQDKPEPEIARPNRKVDPSLHPLQARQKDNSKNSANKRSDDQYEWLNKFPCELEKRGRLDSIGFQGSNYGT